MSDMKMAALMVLRASAELYNDSEILRDAIEGDEHDQFSADYISIELERVQSTARELCSKVNELLSVFASEVDS